jgi:uncharacterized membrane protein YhaH (DUF805 family)
MHRAIEFIFPSRLHRLACFLRGIVVETVSSYLLYAGSISMDYRYVGWPVAVLFLYEMFFIVLPRIRDVGMSGWWLLTAPVPIANIVLGIILLFRAPAMVAIPRPGATIKETSTAA